MVLISRAEGITRTSPALPISLALELQELLVCWPVRNTYGKGWRKWRNVSVWSRHQTGHRRDSKNVYNFRQTTMDWNLDSKELQQCRLWLDDN
jgi:hypothetical protein